MNHAKLFKDLMFQKILKVKECHILNTKFLRQANHSTHLTKSSNQLNHKRKITLSKHFLINPNFIRIPP